MDWPKCFENNKRNDISGLNNSQNGNNSLENW